MRGCLAMALVVGAGAFSATPASYAVPAGLSSPVWATNGLPQGTYRRAAPQLEGPASVASIGAAAAAVAAIALVGSTLRRRAPKSRTTRFYVVGAKEAEEKKELMTGEIYYGEENENGERNYVNPWEERPEAQGDMSQEEASRYGWRFWKYTGPVYKQVPVVDGLQFPLDPKLYDEKKGLEPPPPGAKWGDGRSTDGKWYMDVEGEQTEYWMGWGRRKTATAIVRILKGSGQFLVNGREAAEYFQGNPLWWLKAVEPLPALNEKNNFDVLAKAFGSSYSGQAGAIRLALARAMQEYNYNWRPLLKKAKYLTRDPRQVYAKKTGQPKARKKTPYHKR